MGASVTLLGNRTFGISSVSQLESEGKYSHSCFLRNIKVIRKPWLELQFQGYILNLKAPIPASSWRNRNFVVPC